MPAWAQGRGKVKAMMNRKTTATAWASKLRAAALIVTLVAVFSPGPAVARGPWRASEGNTSGWQYMTPEERIAHQARIRGFTNYADCLAYRQAHHRQMAERAQARGEVLKPGRRDVCAHLLPPGGGG